MTGVGARNERPATRRKVSRAARVIALGLLLAGSAGLHANGPEKQAGSPGESRQAPVLIGYCDYTDVRLIGIWSRRSGWRDPAAEHGESVFKDLLPNGGRWALYHVGRHPITVVSKAPHLSLGVHGERHYYADLAKPVGTGQDGGNRDWLAVSGSRAVDRQQIDVLPNVDDGMTKAIRRGLADAGVPLSPDAVIHLNAGADLDRSWRGERLLVFASGPQPGAALIVVAWRTAAGEFDMSIVARPGDDYRRTEFAMAQVLAVADINGDGRREVAVLWGVADGMGVDLYESGASGLRRVLRHVWGDF